MAGQTISQIRALLAAAGCAPQKRFGQNFLIDLNLMRKLVLAAEVSPADVVLEVGPGTGSLTELLLASGAQVVAVEIDHGLQRILTLRFANEARFQLIGGDALESKHALNPQIAEALGQRRPAAGGSVKLVANLPYQIATPIILELLIAHPSVTVLACTVQKEVGLKLVAPAGSEGYGPLAIVIDPLATVERVAVVPPSAFWPAPDVDSLMLRIVRRPAGPLEITDPRGFSQFVGRAFQQRRKTMRNFARQLGVAQPDEWLAALGFSATKRPENLTPGDWRLLHAAASRVPHRPGE